MGLFADIVGRVNAGGKRATTMQLCKQTSTTRAELEQELAQGNFALNAGKMVHMLEMAHISETVRTMVQMVHMIETVHMV